MRDCARLSGMDLILRSALFARVSKDDLFMLLMVRDAREERAPHHEGYALQHRQASRLRAARKGLVEGGDFTIAEHKPAGRRVVGGVFGG